jgi:hypothetical protein
MFDGMRCNIGMILCLMGAGCSTPDFYQPLEGNIASPFLTVIRPDPPTPPERDRFDMPGTPPAHQSQVVSASANRTEPISAIPQLLPDTVNAPPRRPDMDTIRALVQQAQVRITNMDSYIVRFRRREVIHGRPMPEDLMMCSFRHQPFSVHMKSIGNGPHEGREAIYVAGKHQNLMQVRTGKGDVIPGICLELDPHSSRATANSRRTIDEAGLNTLVQRMVGVVQRVEAGQTQETLTYLGPQQRPESRMPMEAFVQKLLPGQEKLLPQGGKRTFYFNTDPQSAECHLPVLVITQDAGGQEVEYYHYDRLNANLGLTDRDFDPGVLWGKR